MHTHVFRHMYLLADVQIPGYARRCHETRDANNPVDGLHALTAGIPLLYVGVSLDDVVHVVLGVSVGILILRYTS